MRPLTARRSLCVALAALLVCVVASSVAAAGWHVSQRLDGHPTTDLAMAASSPGRTVAAWVSRKRVRVAVALPGRPFARARAISAADHTVHSVRVAVASDGAAIVAFDYFDNSFIDPTDLRSDGCCTGTKVVIVSRSGHVTAPRAVRPRGTSAPLAAVAAGSGRFGVLIGGPLDGGVRFVPISARGRAGAPRTVASRDYAATTLQFRGRRAIAGLLLRTFPGAVAVAAQRADGAFSAPHVVLALADDISHGFIAPVAMTADARGGQVVAYATGTQRASRVRVARVTASGRVLSLAGPSKPLADVQISPPAVDGRGAIAVAYTRFSAETSGVRLVTRAPGGGVLRRTLPALGGLADSVGVAIGGGAVVVSSGSESPRLDAARRPRVFYLRPASGRVTQIALSGLGFGGVSPVVVDRHARARVLWAADAGHARTRLRTP